MAYCISYTLAGLSTDCSTSMGGIKNVYIANYQDDIFALDASGNTITGVSSGVDFYRYDFRQETGNFTSTLEKGDNGNVYVSTEIQLVFTRQETAKRLEMRALSLNDLAVVVVDNNNKVWGFGIDRPVVSSAGGAETGTSFADRNAYTITLRSVDGTFAPELTADAVTALKALVKN